MEPDQYVEYNSLDSEDLAEKSEDEAGGETQESRRINSRQTGDAAGLENQESAPIQSRQTGDAAGLEIQESARTTNYRRRKNNRRKRRSRVDDQGYDLPDSDDESSRSVSPPPITSSMNKTWKILVISNAILGVLAVIIGIFGVSLLLNGKLKYSRILLE